MTRKATKNRLKSNSDFSDKRVPLRTCVGCGLKKPKEDLVRIVLDDGLKVDEAGRMKGRGAYICRDASCIDLAIKKNGFDRTYRCKIPRELTEDLKSRLLLNTEAYETR